jgi:ectoine hydroxylase-related dioxygenase (phytanoyl-CoA dioxygenase family)
MTSRPIMTRIFQAERDEAFFRENGYLVFDLLTEAAIREVWSFYSAAFETKREVHPFAQDLPYYISIFDKDSDHKKKVDHLISAHVRAPVDAVMSDYEVFYSNFMIKFPGDGQIESHQDFNFVDESEYTAFNLWCPLVDTTRQNGGLFVIPGSHLVFRTQRGPNIPKALTRYNELLQRYSIFVPLTKGQAIVFDHKLVHYSPPNRTDRVRVAVQSVIMPRKADAIHYFFDEPQNKVIAYRIDKQYILENDLWNGSTTGLVQHHAEDLVPFPEEDSIIDSLVKLKLQSVKQRAEQTGRPVFRRKELQELFDRDGYVKLPLLQAPEVEQLRDTFAELIGENVSNTDYGMYISLEERDQRLKALLLDKLSNLIVPIAQQHFVNCKPHLGSFLVKAPGVNSFTYPHQDWTFVSTPGCRSLTLWVALVDTDENNGALGFVKGSQHFFDKPIGSPSPDFQTFTQGHEDVLYEYLEFVPLRAGEAIAFDNRTIHGAPPNLTVYNRVAAAIGMTPEEAPLHHFYLLPSDQSRGIRRIAKFRVDQKFFRRYSVASLKELFDRGESPDGYEIEEIIEDVYQPFSRQEIRRLCECAGLKNNGKRLIRTKDPSTAKGAFRSSAHYVNLAKGLASRVRGRLFGANL